MNRLGSAFLRRRPEPTEGSVPRRTATPGKSRWGAVFLPILSLLFLPQGFFFSLQVLTKISANLEGSARNPGEARLDVPADDTGEDAARSLRRSGFLMQWPAPENEPKFLAAVALVYAILWLAILLTTLGAQNQDLGRVEWGFEWLFTFPSRARSLFLAKLLEYAVFNAFTWLTAFPFSATLYLHAGYGWSAIPLAAGVTVCWNLLLAGARLLLETWLRKRLALARVKNLQAIFTLLGMLALYAILYLGITEHPPDWFWASVSAAPAIDWLPPSLPAYLAARGPTAWGIAVALALGTAVISAGSVLLAAHLVRDGLLLSGGGPLQGSRGKAERGDRPSRRLGIAVKDALLLSRDRSFLVQTLVVPILIIGFQVVINRSLLDATSSDLRHGAAFAFGIGAYVLMFTGFSVLSSEGQGLWLLYTFPRPLSAMLRRKTGLWSLIGLMYVGGVLGFLLLRGAVFGPASVPAVLMALLGVLIYAFVAAGLGILGADPFAQQAHRKVRPAMAYLFMLLASMYAYGFYAPSPWQKAVLVVLCSLLAFAIWQKVEDRLPYLLDPTALPPPRIGLSDGLIAVTAFFILQGLVTFIWITTSGADPAVFTGPLLIVTFVVSGSVVVAASLYVFWRLKVPDLLAEVGVRQREGMRSSVAGAAGRGILLGAAAATLGVLYVEAVLRLPFLEDFRQQVLLDDRGLGGDAWWTLPLLAVVAAPLFEEFIFRGLVYRGLRRSFRTSTSVLASAVIFAIIHPPPSVLPVFVLGIATAISFERTGLLVAPIMAHATYNAAMLAVSLWHPTGS